MKGQSLGADASPRAGPGCDFPPDAGLMSLAAAEWKAVWAGLGREPSGVGGRWRNPVSTLRSHVTDRARRAFGAFVALWLLQEPGGCSFVGIE